MGNKFIQPLLKAGLIDTDDKDERLENVEKAITDLQKKFANDYSLLPTYTLVALDPNISDNDPVLNNTEAVLTQHWKTLRNRFPEVPVPVLRSIILHALYNAGMEDAKLARIVYLTGSNFYPYAKLGREKDIIEKILSELGDKAEEQAFDEWSLEDDDPNLKLGSLKISGLQLEKITLSDETLRSKLKAAAKNDPQGHGPYHHQEQWSTHFSKHAGDGIVEFVNSGFELISKSISASSIETPINKFLSEFKKSLDQTLKNSFNSIRAIERRTNLLWWKEAQYSPSIKNSYRTLNKFVQPLMMAYDLFQQVPDITPISVDYLLRDTVLLINSKADEQIKLSEFLNQISTNENKALLKNHFKFVEKGQTRMSLTNFLILMLNDKAQSTELNKFTGLDANELISFTGVAVMVLHDLMAENLIPST